MSGIIHIYIGFISGVMHSNSVDLACRENPEYYRSSYRHVRTTLGLGLDSEERAGFERRDQARRKSNCSKNLLLQLHYIVYYVPGISENRYSNFELPLKAETG